MIPYLRPIIPDCPIPKIQPSDTGIGVRDHLNGELTAMDGIIYSIVATGTATVAPDDLQAPYMSMLTFEPTKTITPTNIECYKSLREAAISQISSINSFCAFRAKGSHLCPFGVRPRRYG